MLPPSKPSFLYTNSLKNRVHFPAEMQIQYRQPARDLDSSMRKVYGSIDVVERSCSLQGTPEQTCACLPAGFDLPLFNTLLRCVAMSYGISAPHSGSSLPEREGVLAAGNPHPAQGSLERGRTRRFRIHRFRSPSFPAGIVHGSFSAPGPHGAGCAGSRKEPRW